MDEVHTIQFRQGNKDLLKLNEDRGESKSPTETIRSKISELLNYQNVHFLFGAGTSSGAIPTMATMYDRITGLGKNELSLFNKVSKGKNKNLEEILGLLYSRRAYKKGVGEKSPSLHSLIKKIETTIFDAINIDFKPDGDTFALYKEFYSKVTHRNKDLARINIFTTNNDLLNEKVMDHLNINYNNGFSGGLDRFFNPALFNYTYSKRMDTSIDKFEPVDSMAYLYKIHGSINWVESKGNTYFNIKELSEPQKNGNHVLIYPNPLKQNKSLGAPYSDLIREFQKKLLFPNGVLFVMGYSFSDEHINNIIYQALATNSSLSIVVFGEHPDATISKVIDHRIYRVFGEYKVDGKSKKIHYFESIVNELLPEDLHSYKESSVLEDFIKKLSEAKS